jgi:hypothetical protein
LVCRLHGFEKILLLVGQAQKNQPVGFSRSEDPDSTVSVMIKIKYLRFFMASKTFDQLESHAIVGINHMLVSQIKSKAV